MEHARPIADLRTALQNRLNPDYYWDSRLDGLAKEYAIALRTEGSSEREVIKEFIGFGVSREKAKVIARDADPWVSRPGAPTWALEPAGDLGIVPARWRVLRSLGVFFLFVWSFCLGGSVHYFVLRFGMGLAEGFELALTSVFAIAATFAFLRWVSFRFPSFTGPPVSGPLRTFVIVWMAPVAFYLSPLSNELARSAFGISFLVALSKGIDVLMARSQFSLRRHVIFVLVIAVGQVAGMWETRLWNYCHLREEAFAEVIQGMGQTLPGRLPPGRHDPSFQPDDSVDLTLGKILVLEDDSVTGLGVSETELLLPERLLALDPSQLGAVVLLSGREPSWDRPSSDRERIRVTIYAWPGREQIFDRWVSFENTDAPGPEFLRRRGQPRGFQPETPGIAKRLEMLLETPSHRPGEPNTRPATGGSASSSFFGKTSSFRMGCVSHVDAARAGQGEG
jgi:hypothetical protein